MTHKTSAAALMVSLAAMALSVYSHVRNDARTTAAIRQAEAAVAAREQTLLAWLTPQLRTVLSEFDVGPYPEDPTTLEAALAPLFRITGG